MRYRIGLADAGEEVNATVFDLAGCATTACDRASLLDLLPVAIAEHLSWLRARGAAAPVDASDIEIDALEEVDPTQSEAADGEFIFADDCRTVTGEDVEMAIRHMEYASADLRAIIAGLPDIVLDWLPPLTAMEKVDPWNPSVRTIREIVWEIATSEGYYRNGLGDDHTPLVEEFQRDLPSQRQRTIDRLRGLSPEERGELFYVTRSWQDRPEHWTARKTMRRIISHERFHTKEIQQRLSWLQLGVPEFRNADLQVATDQRS